MRRIVSIVLAVIMVASIVPVTAFSKGTEQNTEFIDVNGDEYYAQAADALSKLGVLKGYEEDAGFSFGAEKEITRAEMATIICRMIDKEAKALALKGKTDFEDVDDGHWASGYINYTFENKIVSGDGNGKFRPEDNVKYEEAVKMIVCAFGYGDEIESSGKDWALPYIEEAEKHNITEELKGELGKPATRGDVAVMVFNGETEDISAPVITLESGTYKGEQAASLSTTTSNADIHYTLDGSTPCINSQKYEIGAQIAITKSCTLNAITIKKGVYPSEVSSAEYTITAKTSGGGGGGTTKYTVTFDLNYEEAKGTPEKQKVKSGKFATKPEDPTRDGYNFVGWSTDKNGEELFDFETKIKKSIKLYAVWEMEEIEIDKDSDLDNDGITYEMEIYFGLNPDSDDTDGDGLSDYLELILGTDPTKPDTDDDGTLDGDEDTDGDGLTNLEELDYDTDPVDADSDNDGLNDSEEINTYETAPLNSDTDEDGADDGWEVSNDYDPLVYDDNFVVSESVKTDEIEVSATLALDGENVTSLTIEPVTNNLLLDETIPGYIGTPCNFAVEGEFDEATISITFDESLLDDEDFEPTIYYFNEETQLFEELETTIEENVASAVVNHFSVYILLNKTEFEEAWENDIKPPIEDEEASNATLDIVFVIDYSKSMRENDPEQLFKTLSKEFISKLRDEKDRAAVVKFIKKAELVSALTCDKDYLNNKIDGIIYDDGKLFASGTNGSAGYKKALDELSKSEAKYKYIVFITDGEDTKVSYDYDDLIADSVKNNIVVYTIGMGDASEDVLRKIAYETDGKYYHAATSTAIDDIIDLDKVFEKIEGETIDYITDSNEDGISDFYTKLLCDGELTLGTGKDNPFYGQTFDKIQENADFDNDGLLNGEEFVVKYDLRIEDTYIWMASDPTLPDSDFDGTNDIDDLEPTCNTFWGVLSKSFDEGINISFTMDYRNLIDNSNTKYSPQKSELACILATLAYNGGNFNIYSGAKASGNIEKMYELVGLNDYKKISLKKKYSDDDISEFMIGHRLVEYQGQNTEVFVVSVRGTNKTVEEWSSNFDVGSKNKVYWDCDNPEWTNPEHHKGFDVTTNRCYKLIEEYINDHIDSGKIDASADRAIFITGHSRGAAISNLLGKMFEDDEDYISTTYGFATPNTTTSSDADSYKTIFNIVNKDDLVPYLPLEDWGFTKYGKTKAVSIEEDYESDGKTEVIGTWEYLINENREKKLDYNCNGNKKATLESFAELMPSLDEVTVEEIRRLLYVKPYNDESYLELDKSYESKAEALAKKADIEEKYGERLARASDVTIFETTEGWRDKKKVFKIRIEQSPEFLMMALAALASEANPTDADLVVKIFGFNLGCNVAKLYKDAKEQFVQSAVDVVGDDGTLYGIQLGGMEHGHWPETYYLLAKYED